MAFYRQVGTVPQKRHTVLRDDEGALLHEEPGAVPPEDGAGVEIDIDRGFVRSDSRGDEPVACGGEGLLKRHCADSTWVASLSFSAL